MRAVAAARSCVCATLVALSGVAVSGAGCGFAGDAPGAQILCGSDDACPPDRRCDLASHLCTAPGAHAPVVDSATFDPPSLSAGVVKLVLNADTPLSASVAPVLHFGADAAAPPFALLNTDGAHQTLVADVDDTFAAGLYSLVTVDVTGADGITGTSTLDHIGLEIDRTPPGIVAAFLVDAPDDGVYADVAGRNTVTALVQPNEPINLDGASITLGGIASHSCAAAANVAGAVTCSLDVTPVLGDATLTPHVALVDDAGNATDVVLPDVRVDTAPPRIVDGSVTVVLSEGGSAAAALGVAGVLAISFVTSEDVDPAPALALAVDGAPVALELASAIGRRFTFERFGVGAIPPGAYGVTADLSDRFGHTSSAVAVALPAPFAAGIAVVAGAGGGACPAPPGVSCVDLDNDGSFAVSADCPEGGDFADDDPLSGPFAHDLPGDGVDNNGINGDAPIDETTGFFVDDEAGDDANGDGTRAAPVRSIAAALQLASGGAFVWVFLAERDTAYPVPPGDLGANVLGGLDPVTWTRTGGHSKIAGSTIIDGDIDSLDSDTDEFTSDLVVRCNLAAVLGSRSTTVVRSRIGTVGIEGVPVVIFESIVGTVEESEEDVTIIRSEIDQGLSAHGGSVAIVSSFVGGTGVSTFDAGLGIYGSTIVADGGAPALAAEGTDGCAVANSAIIATSPASALVNLSFIRAGVSLLNNDLVAVSSPLLTIDDNAVALADVNTCSFADCLAAAGNISSDPQFISLFHIGPSSPLVGAVVDPLAGGAPTSVLADIDGACRGTAGTDIGADEAL